ncbi:IS21 family transposase [Thiocystis violacea]|uniref:IS21 family transposase n=1 Tax=Thiocystis violacea TaxID=13725 RepID=UPI0030B8C9D2
MGIRHGSNRLRRWRSPPEAVRRVGGGPFVPLTFAPGEAFQFDWSEDGVVIGGGRTQLQVAHFKLADSRAFFLRAYLLQTHERLFDAHAHAFRVLGGIPRRGIYDNMKTAVERVGKGKARDVNPRFQAIASHYLFEPEFCNPAAGWEKGQIEKSGQDSRPCFWQQAPAFQDLAGVNTWLEQRCLELWAELRHPDLAVSVAEVWAEERPSLMAVPAPFDGFVEHPKRVSPTCLIHFECHRYRVPAVFANRPVSLRVYAERLVVVAEGQVIAAHPRLIERRHKNGRTFYDWRHYLGLLQRKPGALRNGAPFAELPEAFKRLQSVRLKRQGGDREMVEILSLVRHHEESLVLKAVEMALAAGAPSKPHLLNLLGRLVESPPPGPVNPPAALTLTLTPECLFRAHSATHSTGIRPLIPR